MSSDDLDALPYGVVGLTSDGMVEIYNATESRMAGLPRASVMHTAFFLATAQCMNNFMVAQRLADEPTLDVTLPYILTFRMRPTPVTLRLLKAESTPRSYLLIRR
ncbi:MAG: phosphonate transporter [Janthinobacterium lividum]